MTESKFGLVPKGSVLAYQKALPTSIPKPDPNICSEFPFPKPFYPDTVLAEKEMLFYDSLTVGYSLWSTKLRPGSNPGPKIGIVYVGCG